MLCPHCQQEHPEASRFCPKTGAPLDWAMPTCPSCGREVRPGTRFCAACGQALPREIHRSQRVAQAAPAQTNTIPAANAETPPIPEHAAQQDTGNGVNAAGGSAAPTPPSSPIALAADSQPAQPGVSAQKPIRSEPPPQNGPTPALAWTAIPTGPHSRIERERRAQQKHWLTYLLGALVVIAALVGMAAVWRQFGAGARPIASALLSASATAAARPAGAAQSSPSPVPPTVPPTSAPSPIPPSPTPLAVVAATPPPPSATPTSATAPNYQLAFFSNRDNLSVIYLMDPDHPINWQAVPVPENYEITAWPSFCGGRLAFEARDRSFALPLWIFLYNLEQDTVEPLAIAGELPERLMDPNCSPSGRWMILNSFRAGDWFLSLFDSESNEIVAERLSGEYASLGSATWPQAEDRFFWMGTRTSGYFDINETRLVDDNKFSTARLIAQGKYPAISPDGKRMVSFCGNLLYLCMVERATNTLLFQIPVSYFKQVDRKVVPASAAWSSDGKWVYFSSSTSGNWDIYRMRPDGSMIQNLTEDWPSDELMPAAR